MSDAVVGAVVAVAGVGAGVEVAAVARVDGVGVGVGVVVVAGAGVAAGLAAGFLEGAGEALAGAGVGVVGVAVAVVVVTGVGVAAGASGLVGVVEVSAGTAWPSALASLATSSDLLPLVSKPLFVSSVRSSVTLSLLISTGVVLMVDKALAQKITDSAQNFERLLFLERAYSFFCGEQVIRISRQFRVLSACMYTKRKECD